VAERHDVEVGGEHAARDLRTDPVACLHAPIVRSIIRERVAARFGADRLPHRAGRENRCGGHASRVVAAESEAADLIGLTDRIVELCSYASGSQNASDRTRFA
jgi:hypothetical protein